MATCTYKKTVLGDSTNTYTNYPAKPLQLSVATSMNQKRLRQEPGSKGSLTSITPSSSLSTASSVCFSEASSYATSLTDLDQYENGSYEMNENSFSMAKNKKKAQIDDTKYKTELCKNWMELGKCNYGKKCKFAHGRDELVGKQIPTRGYKSKKCNSFYTKMYCPYGVRCMFAHEQRSMEEINCDHYYQKFLSFPELMEGPVIQRKARLPIFEELGQADECNPAFNLHYLTDSEAGFEGFYGFGFGVYTL